MDFALAAIALLFLATFAAPYVSAQIGEVAGVLGFGVQVGHNETIGLTVLNEGGSSIGFTVLVPSSLQLTSAPNTSSQQMPTVTAYPLQGTVPPRGAAVINVTVSMPLNDTPGLASWEGIIQVIQSSNNTNPGGAVLQEGVAKIFSVGAIASTTTSTSSTSTASTIPFSANQVNPVPYLILIMWILIVLFILWYLTMVRKRRSKQGGKKAGRQPKGRRAADLGAGRPTTAARRGKKRATAAPRKAAGGKPTAAQIRAAQAILAAASKPKARPKKKARKAR